MDGMVPCVLPSMADFQCAICWNLLHNPVVGPCGHDFCELCYKGCVATQSRPKCPLCRGRLSHIVPGVCKRLQTTVATLFPDAVKARQRTWHPTDLSQRTPPPLQATAYSSRSPEGHTAQGGGNALGEAAATAAQVNPQADMQPVASHTGSCAALWLQAPPLGSCVFTVGFTPPECGRRRIGTSSRQRNRSAAVRCTSDGRCRQHSQQRTAVGRGALHMAHLQ